MCLVADVSMLLFVLFVLMDLVADVLMLLFVLFV
jgi:hypothetical protein